MQTFIQVSGEDVPVEFTDFIDLKKQEQHWRKNVTSRLRNPFKQDKYENDVVLNDCYLRVRTDDDGHEYYEWLSPTMNYANKRMSVSTDKKADFPYFIAFMTPWVRWNREDKVNEVLYSSIQWENAAEKLENNGFAEDDVAEWVPAERVKQGDEHVWRRL